MWKYDLAKNVGYEIGCTRFSLGAPASKKDKKNTKRSRIT